MNDIAAVADAYFRAIRFGDEDALGELFAPDAELVTTAGTYRGRDEIVRFYATLAFAVRDRDPRPGPYLIDDGRLAVEIDLRMDGRPSPVADFFEVEDGLIRRLAVYMLPSAP